jgi:hypothetical protein
LSPTGNTIGRHGNGGGTFVEIVHSLNGRMAPHSGQDVPVY